jgi:beta-glucosidase
VGFPSIYFIMLNIASIIRTIAAASTVLLKNKNNVLPLKKPTSLAVIGKWRDRRSFPLRLIFLQAVILSPTPQATMPVLTVTAILEHLLKAGQSISPDSLKVTSYLKSLRGSGTGEYPYLSDALSAIKSKASSDGTSITSATSDTDTNAAANAARGKTAAIVVVTGWSILKYAFL